YINLSYNAIVKIAPSVFLLDSLIELRLHNNLIKTVPKNISKCKSLELVDLCRNRIGSFPVFNDNIRIVLLSYNRIKRVKYDSQLQNVTYIDLRYNKLIKLYGRLSFSPRLKAIYLTGN